MKKKETSVLTIDEANRKQKADAFLKLVKKNPTLPIIPMVDWEIVGDEWGRWMGAFGYAEVGEYAIYDDRYYTDREDFTERYYDLNDEALCEKFSYEPCINSFALSQGKCTQEQLKENEINEKRLNEYLDKVAEEYFVKAIIVNIDMP